MDKKKAAAYARVSSKGIMQIHSYSFQSRYWNERLSKANSKKTVMNGRFRIIPSTLKTTKDGSSLEFTPMKA